MLKSGPEGWKERWPKGTGIKRTGALEQGTQSTKRESNILIDFEGVHSRRSYLGRFANPLISAPLISRQRCSQQAPRALRSVGWYVSKRPCLVWGGGGDGRYCYYIPKLEGCVAWEVGVWYVVIWDGRIYPYPSEIQQGWHQALDDSILCWFCVERAPMGTCDHEHATCHVIGGENDEIWGPCWKMMCCGRCRIEQSKIQHRMGTYKRSDRYISLCLSRYCSLCLYR